MKAPKKISEKLYDYMLRTDDLKIKGWLFNFDEGRDISIGLYNNKLGGPYTPPSVHDAYGGAAYIIWDDGRISDVKINSAALEDLDASLKEWRALSYHDADAPEILEPLPMPTGLKIKDDRVAEAVKDRSYFFEMLDFYNKELKKRDYTKTIKGEVEAKYRHFNVMNSKGLDVEWEETIMETVASVNDKFWDVYRKRNMPEKKDLKAIIRELDRYMIHSQNLVDVKSGNIPLVITPSVLGGLLGKLLIGENLKGQIVANNQSLFSVEDFKTKKQVFDERINLVMDGLKDYSVGTLPCSPEGVPSTKQYVIADGRLVTPLLDLKYAKKTGMAPVSVGDLSLEANKKMPYGKMISEIDYGLIVYLLLGMHTLNSKEGDYSLTVAEGLLVEDGKIKGAVKDKTIAGNLFNALRDEKTKFAKYRKDETAMLTETNVKGAEE